MRREEQQEGGGKNSRGEHTFCELSILFDELLLSVELEEAVVPQAMSVRQTLHYCIQETLVGNRAKRKVGKVIQKRKEEEKKSYLWNTV